MDRHNINRGFKKLRVWGDAVGLYVLACEILTGFPFELKKVASNAIDAAHSISRNIAEGYCRRSLREYLNLLNIAPGSCGEFIQVDPENLYPTADMVWFLVPMFQFSIIPKTPITRRRGNGSRSCFLHKFRNGTIH
jgi:hypothetical protein